VRLKPFIIVVGENEVTRVYAATLHLIEGHLVFKDGEHYIVAMFAPGHWQSVDVQNVERDL